MSISPISGTSTDTTQSLADILLAQLQAKISQQIADKKNSAANNTISSTAPSLDSAQISPQALQASKRVSPLDTLVSNGTITKDQENIIAI